MHLVRVWILFGIFASVGSLAATRASHAHDLLLGNSLEEVVAQSAKVARIRITKRVPLQTPEMTEPCGYMYSARVVESFKGGTDPFEFVAHADQDFVGFDHDYLVMALHNFDMTPEVDVFLRHMLSPEEEERVRCRTAATNYYVPGAHRMLWVIQELSGEEWLAPDTRPLVAWCRTEGNEGEMPGGRQVKLGSYVYDAIQWQPARNLITRAVTARPYLSDGTVDPKFRPGLCPD